MSLPQKQLPCCQEMDASHLRLKRVVISNFKSLKRVELDNLPSLVLFMGRNNAGKSNILDAFKFLSDAATSLDHALVSRGGTLSEVLFRKQTNLKMEFVFEFLLSPEKRCDWIAQLFVQNKLVTVEQVLGSSFLSALTLKISLGADQFSEELSTTNLRAGSSALLFSIKGNAQNVDCTSGCLDSLSARCSGELPSEPRMLESKPVGAAPLRLRLGRPDSDGGQPVSYALAELVFQQFGNLEWVDPLRKLPTSSPIQGQLTLAHDASNLPDVLHWLYNNKPKQFRRIETEVAKLVPQLGKLYTPTVQNTATLGLIDSRDEDLMFSMDQMSFGTRSLIAIIAKVVLAKPGMWVCIEEPETYLHPKAQMGLFHFLRDEALSKRIFIATHSTSIAATCPVESLFVVQRDPSNCTAVIPVTEKNAVEVIEQLGVKPSFSFEAQVLVLVEDADDVPLYEGWAKKLEIPIVIQFLDMEDGATLHYYANARVAVSRFVQTLVYVVFGQRSEAAGLIQDKVILHLKLPPRRVIILDTFEPEGYLLDAKAILKSWPALPLSEAELEERLAPARTRPGQKQALRELFAEFKLADYNGTHGARILEQVEAIPAPILQLLERIDIDSEPVWNI